MWRINVAIGVGSAWREAYAIVVVRDDVFETILFAIAFQRRHQTVALQSFLGDLFKLRKQLAFQLALQRLPLSATHTYTHTLQLSMLELGLEFNVLPTHSRSFQRRSSQPITWLILTNKTVQCYLPPDTSECTPPKPSQAGTWLTYPGGMEGWVDLGGWLYIEMVYPPTVLAGPDIQQLQWLRKMCYS